MSEISLVHIQPTPNHESLIAKPRALMQGAKTPATLRVYRSYFAELVRFSYQHLRYN